MISCILDTDMTHTYSVLGMDCEDCAKKIKNLLAKVPGITSMQIDVPTNTAVIQMDTHTGVDVFNGALKGTNYLLQDERMVQIVGMKTKPNGIKRFFPLIAIFAFIIFATWISLLVNLDWDWLYAMRIFEGLFFIIFGCFKLLNWRGFADAYQTYDLLAKRSRLYAYAYPLIEVALGLSYLSGIYLEATSIATIIIMGVSAIGVFIALKNKEKIQCACLGVVFKIPMTKVTLFEDLLMIIMAGIMLIWS